MATNKAEFAALQGLFNEINDLLKKENLTKKDAEKASEAFDHLKYYASMKEQFNQLIERSLSYNGAGCNKLHKKVLKFVHMGKLNIVKITGLNDSYPNWTDGDLQIITSVVQYPEYYASMKEQFNQLIEQSLSYNGAGCNKLHKEVLKFVHMGKLNIVKITGLNDRYPNWTDGDLQIITSVVEHPECYVEEHRAHYGALLRRFRAHLGKNPVANQQQCIESEAFCKKLSIV